MNILLWKESRYREKYLNNLTSVRQISGGGTGGIQWTKVC